MRGFFINLDEDLDRRVHIEKQLASAQLLGDFVRTPGVRFKGEEDIDLTHGQVGCFMSHVACLNQIVNDATATHVIIFEDDVVIPKTFDWAIKLILENMKNYEWDILHLNQVMDLGQYFFIKNLLKIKNSMADVHHPYNAHFRLLQADKRYSAGTSAYIVNAASSKKIISHFSQVETPAIPFDTKLRDLYRSKKLIGYVLFPFLCGLVPTKSSIGYDEAIMDPSNTFVKLTNIFASNQDIRHLPPNVSADVCTDAMRISDLYLERFSACEAKSF